VVETGFRIDKHRTVYYPVFMGQAIFSVHTDEQLEKQFDTLRHKFGMNTATAITVFAKTVVREQKIPFEIAVREDPFWSETNQAHLKRAAADVQAGIIKTRISGLLEQTAPPPAGQ
jgi:DNA-damage-inducible protein J